MCQIHTVLKDTVACVDDVLRDVEVRPPHLSDQIGLPIGYVLRRYLHAPHHYGLRTLQPVLLGEMDQKDRVWTHGRVDVQSEFATCLREVDGDVIGLPEVLTVGNLHFRIWEIDQGQTGPTFGLELLQCLDVPTGW